MPQNPELVAELAALKERFETLQKENAQLQVQLSGATPRVQTPLTTKGGKNNDSLYIGRAKVLSYRTVPLH